MSEWPDVKAVGNNGGDDLVNNELTAMPFAICWKVGGDIASRLSECNRILQWNSVRTGFLSLNFGRTSGHLSSGCEAKRGKIDLWNT